MKFQPHNDSFGIPQIPYEFPERGRELSNESGGGDDLRFFRKVGLLVNIDHLQIASAFKLFVTYFRDTLNRRH